MMVKITKLILFYGFFLYLHPVSGPDPDPDPKPRVMDPAKSFGSMRIRIHNTVINDRRRFICALRIFIIQDVFLSFLPGF
jgi:hypothetical protein